MARRFVGSERFLDPDAAETGPMWEALKRRLPVDSPVRGVVYACQHYGAWVDLGVGFPTLLEIIYVRDLTGERYAAGDWCPVGSTIDALVLAYREKPSDAGRGGAVYLWQVKPPSPPHDPPLERTGPAGRRYALRPHAERRRGRGSGR